MAGGQAHGRMSGPREAWTPLQPAGLCAVFTAGTSVRLGQHDGNRRKSPGDRGAFFHNLIGCLVPGERDGHQGQHSPGHPGGSGDAA